MVVKFQNKLINTTFITTSCSEALPEISPSWEHLIKCSIWTSPSVIRSTCYCALWSHKTKIKPFAHAYHQHLWWKKEDCIHQKALKPAVKYDWSLMLWQCFKPGGSGDLVKTDGIMNPAKFDWLCQEVQTWPYVELSPFKISKMMSQTYFQICTEMFTETQNQYSTIISSLDQYCTIISLWIETCGLNWRGQEGVVQDLWISVSNLARYYRASDKILMVRKPSCVKHKMSVCLRFKYHLLHIFLHEGCNYIYIYMVKNRHRYRMFCFLKK